MRNWDKWNARSAQRSERGRKAAEARWARVHSERAAEPVRQTRVVEIVIRDSMMPLRTIRMEAEPREMGWSRWAVTENGLRAGRRRYGASAVALAIARTL